MAARQAHNLKVVGSNPTPATTLRSDYGATRGAAIHSNYGATRGAAKLRYRNTRRSINKSEVCAAKLNSEVVQSKKGGCVYYVYIIQMKNGLKYTGYTTDLDERMIKHKQGSVRTTRVGKYDDMLFCAAFKNKILALKFEKYLKSSSGNAFRNKHLL